jgi:hypothetical protein
MANVIHSADEWCGGGVGVSSLKKMVYISYINTSSFFSQSHSLLLHFIIILVPRDISLYDMHD